MEEIEGVPVAGVVRAKDDLAGSLLDSLLLVGLRGVDRGRPIWERVCKLGENERRVHAHRRTLRNTQQVQPIGGKSYELGDVFLPCEFVVQTDSK